MSKKCKQISLYDIYTDIASSMEQQKPKLITLLDEYIDFYDLISYKFQHAFYKYFGRKHKYHLISFIKALVIKSLLNFSDSQLIIVLNLSSELREFCEFDKIPDASYFTRFKQNFSEHIVELFEHLVDITEPICKEIDQKKAEYLIFDTTGIEPQVAENNPKFFYKKLNEAKNIAKTNPDYKPYLGVYSLLPDTSAANSNIKQQYINGHYCYAYKVGVTTNGLGIIRHLSIFDDDFKEKHPDIVHKKSHNPNLDKEISDSSALKADLNDFFTLHKDFHYSTFLGDSAFDSYDIYSMLKDTYKFERACIPLNIRNSKKSNAAFNEFGTPICPVDKTPFTFLGKSGGKNRSLRYKWVCHKSIAKGKTRVCTCDHPCTDSTYGKCTYTYPDKDFRLYPGIPRNTKHWDNLYKHRVLVERTINSLKYTFGVGDPKTYNSKTIKADLFFAGITQLLGVVLAKAINKPELYKSIKKLIS